MGSCLWNAVAIEPGWGAFVLQVRTTKRRRGLLGIRLNDLACCGAGRTAPEKRADIVMFAAHQPAIRDQAYVNGLASDKVLQPELNLVDRREQFYTVLPRGWCNVIDVANVC